MEWKARREQHPGGMGDGVPHINNMSDQRFRSQSNKRFTISEPQSTTRNRAISETIFVCFDKNFIIYNKNS